VSQLTRLFLDVLYQIILPIFLVLGSGFAVSRKLQALESTHPHTPGTDSLRVLSTLVFYVLGPCLAFSSLVTSDVSASEMSQIGLFILVMTSLAGAIAWALARALHLSPAGTSSLLMVAIFGNVGNFGLPLNELAFGQQALERAVIYMVITAVLIYSLGPLIAAHAQGGTLAQVWNRVVRIPIFYALLLAGLVRVGVLPLLDPVLEATLLLARGAVPLMLLILGLQLARMQVRGNWRLIGLASGVRLLLLPLIAVPLAGGMGLTGLAHQVSIIEASMPSAVFNIILAAEFDLDLDLATGVVFFTTLASPVTLIPLISYLRA
jgi:predicted permease